MDVELRFEVEQSVEPLFRERVESGWIPRLISHGSDSMSGQVAGDQGRATRQTLGADPWSRLNARLNASSDS